MYIYVFFFSMNNYCFIHTDRSFVSLNSANVKTFGSRTIVFQFDGDLTSFLIGQSVRLQCKSEVSTDLLF